MDDAQNAQLQRVIQAQHGAAASFARTVRVHRGAKPAEWDGMVHVFDLKNHPSAARAFAWSSPIAGGNQPRFFAVLQSNQIATPLQAVKAASAAIRKWGAKGTGS